MPPDALSSLPSPPASPIKAQGNEAMLGSNAIISNNDAELPKGIPPALASVLGLQANQGAEAVHSISFRIASDRTNLIRIVDGKEELFGQDSDPLDVLRVLAGFLWTSGDAMAGSSKTRADENDLGMHSAMRTMLAIQLSRVLQGIEDGTIDSGKAKTEQAAGTTDDMGIRDSSVEPGRTMPKSRQSPSPATSVPSRSTPPSRSRNKETLPNSVLSLIFFLVLCLSVMLWANGRLERRLVSFERVELEKNELQGVVAMLRASENLVGLGKVEFVSNKLDEEKSSAQLVVDAIRGWPVLEVDKEVVGGKVVEVGLVGEEMGQEDQAEEAVVALVEEPAALPSIVDSSPESKLLELVRDALKGPEIVDRDRSTTTFITPDETADAQQPRPGGTAEPPRAWPMSETLTSEDIVECKEDVRAFKDVGDVEQEVVDVAAATEESVVVEEHEKSAEAAAGAEPTETAQELESAKEVDEQAVLDSQMLDAIPAAEGQLGQAPGLEQDPTISFPEATTRAPDSVTKIESPADTHDVSSDQPTNDNNNSTSLVVAEDLALQVCHSQSEEFAATQLELELARNKSAELDMKLSQIAKEVRVIFKEKDEQVESVLWNVALVGAVLAILWVRREQARLVDNEAQQRAREAKISAKETEAEELRGQIGELELLLSRTRADKSRLQVELGNANKRNSNTGVGQLDVDANLKVAIERLTEKLRRAVEEVRVIKGDMARLQARKLGV